MEMRAKSSSVTPAEAGVQPGQCQTRVFTQALKPGVTKPNWPTTEFFIDKQAGHFIII
jgi:hypothetical protein